jgi:hypothetical protein
MLHRLGEASRVECARSARSSFGLRGTCDALR